MRDENNESEHIRVMETVRICSSGKDFHLSRQLEWKIARIMVTESGKKFLVSFSVPFFIFNQLARDQFGKLKTFHVCKYGTFKYPGSP